MNFLQRIKKDLDDTGRGGSFAGYGRVITDASALGELARHFEQLDSDARVRHGDSRKIPLEQVLEDTITAIYHEQGKNLEAVLLVFMATLYSLSKERAKELTEKTT